VQEFVELAGIVRRLALAVGADDRQQLEKW
jgi:hypothetical protein